MRFKMFQNRVSKIDSHYGEILYLLADDAIPQIIRNNFEVKINNRSKPALVTMVYLRLPLELPLLLVGSYKAII